MFRIVLTLKQFLCVHKCIIYDARSLSTLITVFQWFQSLTPEICSPIWQKGTIKSIQNYLLAAPACAVLIHVLTTITGLVWRGREPTNMMILKWVLELYCKKRVYFFLYSGGRIWPLSLFLCPAGSWTSAASLLWPAGSSTWQRRSETSHGTKSCGGPSSFHQVRAVKEKKGILEALKTLIKTALHWPILPWMTENVHQHLITISWDWFQYIHRIDRNPAQMSVLLFIVRSRSQSFHPRVEFMRWSQKTIYYYWHHVFQNVKQKWRVSFFIMQREAAALPPVIGIFICMGLVLSGDFSSNN